MQRRAFRTAGQTRAPLYSAVLLIFFLLPAGRAQAAAREFIPKYVDFLADFGVKGIYEEDRISGDVNRNARDFLMQEGFSTKGYGYIYSPLFVTMETAIGLGLQQERIDNNGETYSYYDGNATQFKQRFKILPTHPYNLELYFQRTTPMTSGNAGGSGATTYYEHGARALYDKRPWSTALTYTNREATTGSESEHETMLYTLSYYLSDLSVNGTYGHTTSSRYGGLSDTVHDQYNLGLIKYFDSMRFTSRWTRDEEDDNELFADQTKRTFLTEQEQLYSELQIDLPHNFDSTLSYDRSDRSSRSRRARLDTVTATESDRYAWRLHHRLFKSLSSSFSAGYQNTDATGGETNQQDYRLTVDYAKNIPWGTLLTGVWNGLSYTDNQGAPTTLFEIHTIDATRQFFTITYQPQTINRETIEVFIIDHKDNDRQIPLTEGIGYRLDWIGLYYRVTILPAALDELEDPSGDIWDYRYRADYSFVAADYELENKSWGSSLQLPLFNNLISPHYTYIQHDQTVLDGVYPGEPAHSKSHSIGLGFTRSPFRGDVTQSWLRSTTTDEDRLTTSVGYSRDITTTTTGFLSLSFEDVQTTQFDLVGNEADITLSEQFYTAQAQVQTVLPEKNLNASLSGNYTLYQGVGESTILSFFSTLVWHVGKLDFDISASYTTSDSALADSNSTRSYTMVRFTIKRKIL